MSDVHVRVVSAHAGAEGSASTDQPATVMYRLGGRRYPLRSAPNCHVCQSFEYRQEIESSLLKSYSVAAIHRSLPPDSGISIDSIRNHLNSGHLPLDAAMRRVVIEERAREMGLSVEDHEGAMADHITFAKLGVQSVVERMASGELVPDMKDGIALAALLARVQETAGEGIDNEVMVQAFMVYMEAIRATCTPEQIRAIGEAVASNPVMAGLMGRVQAAIPVTSNGAR